MRAADLPKNEQERIDTLRSLLILDTPCEERFDGVTAYAAATFKVPMCLISFVDTDRQWFKSHWGLPDVRQTSREVSFCGHTILGDGLFQVRDARAEPDFHDNPLVTGAPHIRFYAGYPLKMQNGQNVGTLCLLDRRPRTLQDWEQQQLASLAKMVAAEIQGLPYSPVPGLRLTPPQATHAARAPADGAKRPKLPLGSHRGLQGASMTFRGSKPGIGV